MKGKKKYDKFTTGLRINPQLADKIKKAANTAKRSMNAEIELALEEKYS